MGNDRFIDESSENMINKVSEGQDHNVVENSEMISSQEKKSFKDGIVYRIIMNFLFLLGSIVLVAFLGYFVVFIAPSLQESRSVKKAAVITDEEFIKEAGYKKQIGQIKKDVQNLSKRYNGFTSGQSYIVINTTDNKFALYKNKQLIREGSCSTGSFTMLKGKGNKKWVFKTPRGQFTVRGKRTNPVWTRPDWSFVEEGLPIPSPRDESRYEPGVLGDYALTLGDGYMIHGTIYKRFLGMPVTHGCVRLNDEDLDVVFHTLNVGSKVYIY